MSTSTVVEAAAEHVADQARVAVAVGVAEDVVPVELAELETAAGVAAVVVVVLHQA